MPEFYIKKGLAEKALKDWIEEHKDEPFVRVNIEVESTHERLRRSFHVLLKEWFKSGEWSCNGAEIYTFKRFRDYYKYEGCDRQPVGFSYRGEEFLKEKGEDIIYTLDRLKSCFPGANNEEIKPIVKSWIKMTKKEKSKSLDLLFTEIRHSMTTNSKVLEWVAKISHDEEMLRDINYYKYKGE